MRKWLNITTRDSDYSADTDDDDNDDDAASDDSASDTQGNHTLHQLKPNSHFFAFIRNFFLWVSFVEWFCAEYAQWVGESRFRGHRGENAQPDPNGTLYNLRLLLLVSTFKYIVGVFILLVCIFWWFCVALSWISSSS